MKLSFFSIFCLCFFNTKAQHSLLIKSHTDKLQNSKVYLLELAAKMPEEFYGFKPVESEMSFNAQLIHICENLYWLSSKYIGEVENPLDANKPKAENMKKADVLKLIEIAYNYATTSIQNLSKKSMKKTFDWRKGKMNKYQFINLIQDHQTHHHGQLIVYLRLKGIEPPKYVGW